MIDYHVSTMGDPGMDVLCVKGTITDGGLCHAFFATEPIELTSGWQNRPCIAAELSMQILTLGVPEWVTDYQIAQLAHLMQQVIKSRLCEARKIV